MNPILVLATVSFAAIGVAGAARAESDNLPLPPGVHAGAPTPPPEMDGPGRDGQGGFGQPGFHHPPPPFPPRLWQQQGARFRIEVGDDRIDVKCADNEPMRACAEIVVELLDRVLDAGGSPPAAPHSGGPDGDRPSPHPGPGDTRPSAQ